MKSLRYLLTVLVVQFVLASRALAQDPNAPGSGNEVGPAGDSTLTNLVDLLSDMAPDNGPAAEEATPGATSNINPGGTSASGDYYRRPSGRDSRSQRNSRSRSNRTNGSYSSSYGGSGFVGTNADPNSLEWAAFQSVVTGNIFDPNRTPGRGVYVPPTVHSRERDYFTLVGTMSYQEGTFAFFDGRSSEYQKAMKRSDIIAGYKVAAIDDDSVKLTRDTNQVELHVGMQMRQDDDGSWHRSSGSTSLAASSVDASTTSTPTSVSASTATVPSGPQSDILKKMMERREKE